MRGAVVLAGLIWGPGLSCSPQSVLLATAEGPTEVAGAAGSSGGGGVGSISGVAGSTPVNPLQIGSVDLSSSGPGIRLLVGDVSGDGRFDIVAMQPDKVPDGKTPHSVLALTAFDLDGKRLWQVGTPDPTITGSSSDIPAQIYDLDGDGFNEVVAVMDDKLVVLDGRSGAKKSEHDLPDPNAHDAIVFANLRGHGRADDIVLKDRFSNLWAYDNGFNPLFKYSGALSYYPWPYDWNGDGRDEILAACRFLDSDGTELWSCDSVAGDAQIDAVWAADIDPSAENGPEVLMGAGDVLCFDTHGTLLFRTDTAEAQNIVVGDFRPDLPGLEIGGLDRVQRGANGTDAMFMISSNGKMLVHEERPEGSGWSTIVTMMHDWDGTERDLIVAYGRAGEPPALYDGQLNRVATFPDETGQLIAADVCGDQREEIIAFNDSRARVYAAESCDLRSHETGKPRRQPKRLYNWTRNWGGEYP